MQGELYLLKPGVLFLSRKGTNIIQWLSFSKCVYEDNIPSHFWALWGAAVTPKLFIIILQS